MESYQLTGWIKYVMPERPYHMWDDAVLTNVELYDIIHKEFLCSGPIRSATFRTWSGGDGDGMYLTSPKHPYKILIRFDVFFPILQEYLNDKFENELYTMHWLNTSQCDTVGDFGGGILQIRQFMVSKVFGKHIK